MAQIIRIFLYIFPALILFTVFLPLYFKLKWREEKNSAAIVKGLCTLVPVIFCLNGCLINRFAGFWWLLAGLVFCFIGDVAIEKNLYAGLAAFLLAHCLFIWAFSVFAKPDLAALPVFIVLFAAAGFVLRRSVCKLGFKSVPFILYAGVLFAMLALALTLPFTIGTGLIAAGALLFVVSDVMLAYGILNNKKYTRTGDVICLACYYLALYLIALAVWV